MDTSAAEATFQVSVVEAPAGSDATSSPAETRHEALQRYFRNLAVQGGAKVATGADPRGETTREAQFRLAEAHGQWLREQLASVQRELRSAREQLTAGQRTTNLRQEINRRHERVKAKVEAKAKKDLKAFETELNELAKKQKGIKRRLALLGTSLKECEATIARYRVLNGLVVVLIASGLLGCFGYPGALSTEVCFGLPLAISACIAVASGTPAVEARLQKAGSNQGAEGDKRRVGGVVDGTADQLEMVR